MTTYEYMSGEKTYKYRTNTIKEIRKAMSYFLKTFHRPAHKLKKVFITEMHFYSNYAVCKYYVQKKHKNIADFHAPSP